jgi:hypothetical protein
MASINQSTVRKRINQLKLRRHGIRVETLSKYGANHGPIMDPLKKLTDPDPDPVSAIREKINRSRFRINDP